MNVIHSQNQLSVDEMARWNQLENTQISSFGNWVGYSLDSDEGPRSINLHESNSGKTFSFERAYNLSFSSDEKHAIFLLGHGKDETKDLKRVKTKEDDFPKDTLTIFNLTDRAILKIPYCQSYILSDSFPNLLTYQIYDRPKDPTDTTSLDTSIVKKSGKDNGYDLIIHDLNDRTEDTLKYVLLYHLPVKGSRLLGHSTGMDSTMKAGLYAYDFIKRGSQLLLETVGKVEKINADEKGENFAFLLDSDTTKIRVRPHNIYLWGTISDTPKVVVNHDNIINQEGHIINHHHSPYFSKDGSKMFFYSSPPPTLRDTNILDEEVADVEIWHSEDAYIYPMQNNRIDEIKNKGYLNVFFLKDNIIGKITDNENPQVSLPADQKGDYALVFNNENHAKQLTWKGRNPYDVQLVNYKNNTQKLIAYKLDGRPSISPNSKFVYWYDYPSSRWKAYNTNDEKTIHWTDNKKVSFSDELNDRPMDPFPYGLTGFSEDEEFVFIYDRYDIWKISTNGKLAPQNLTKGRKQKIQYRRIRLDYDEHHIDLSEPNLVHLFDEKDKSSGYALLDFAEGGTKELIKANKQFNSSVRKAKKSDVVVFTQEDFQEFPDLWIGKADKMQGKKISNANPQQDKFSWGKIELYTWKDNNGHLQEGMIAFPDDFNPKKKYPMIVNFYERSSNRLHRHNNPQLGRSTINYHHYNSKGYIIFNPDIQYIVGDPGKSCLDIVVSGVESLIDKGYVDKKRIGLQGHSWGGYQAAHILNHTDLFRCAESGAPVVNMVSAYGGIRWGSGMSRMFQYEQTQSRLGGTLWSNRDAYLRNSPIFEIDKMNTPVLILHNDQDGAVPWYQGIEYYMALRRLDKKAWLLNYRGEPHWPVKPQNRKDFQKRMEQFFDHYLMDAPMPQWMSEGIPAEVRGIELGY